jgi:hypothetical protein
MPQMGLMRGNLRTLEKKDSDGLDSEEKVSHSTEPLIDFGSEKDEEDFIPETENSEDEADYEEGLSDFEDETSDIEDGKDEDNFD